MNKATPKRMRFAEAFLKSHQETTTAITSSYAQLLKNTYLFLKRELYQSFEFTSKDLKKIDALFNLIEMQSKKHFRRIELLKQFLVDTNLSDSNPYHKIPPAFFNKLVLHYELLHSIIFNSIILANSKLT